ncbi:neprilysin-21-like [Ornithodoros turicata]|uniref:neprilysin-21-like n=1 Tax=Ornithodoros turicata TaxID=34597 RepID=UPI003138A141
MGVEPSSVTKDTYIAVKSVGYVKELGYVFGNNSKSTLLDLIAWRLMRAVSPLLPEAFRDLTLSFAGQQTMGGAPPPYDLACYNLLEPPLRFAFARAYVEEHGHRYTEPLMAHVRKTMRHLQDEMLQMLNGSSLMDKHTFNNAMDKIRDMKWRMVDPLKSTPSQNLSLILEKGCVFIHLSI